MLSNFQVSVLNLLQEAKLKSESNRGFATTAHNMINMFKTDSNPYVQNQFSFLEQSGYIKNGRITEKGSSIIINNPRYLSNIELQKRMNFHLFEAISREKLENAMSFWSDETLTEVTNCVLVEICNRVDKGYQPSSLFASFVQDYNTYQEPPVIELPQEVIVDEQVVPVTEVKPKRTRKKKELIFKGE